MTQDSLLEYSSSIERLRKDQQPFILATVVRVHGSASARVGSKAIFDQTGKNIFGWIGGGCAERFVGEQAVESLHERKGRIVLADLDDEIFGLGVACGGKMEVFIDPVPQLEIVNLPRTNLLDEKAEQLANAYGVRIQWENSGKQIQNLEDLFLELSQVLAKQRNKTGLSLRETKELPVQFGKIKSLQKSIAILGRGRIVDAIAEHFSMLGWKTRTLTSEQQHEAVYTAGECVVIASHTSRDPQLVKNAYAQKASYIGMIGSRKRALEVIEHLKLDEQKESDIPLFIPAGIDFDARNPDEIGLSVVAEVLSQLKANL